MRPALKHPIPLDLKQALRTLPPIQREVIELQCGLREDGKRWSLRDIAALPSQPGAFWQSVAVRRDLALKKLWDLGYQAFQVLEERLVGESKFHWSEYGGKLMPGCDLVERVM